MFGKIITGIFEVSLLVRNYEIDDYYTKYLVKIRSKSLVENYTKHLVKICSSVSKIVIEYVDRAIR